MPEVDRLRKMNDQMKRELGIERQKVSVVANSLKEYCISESDPLVDGVPKRDNPFIKKSSCTIL
uniref:Guanine nucleotide-binding protein subunit gamma n=1 Tax=Amphimedon queenslandica TaxID=400682 RepID=A0A1X7V7S5_AMPQE